MNTSSFFKNSRIAITGGTGTIGKQLVRQLLQYNDVAEVRALDNNESDLFFLAETCREDNRLQVYLTDVRDSEKMKYIFKGIDFVFHTAAFKHVPLCEQSPFDAVQTNIIGVQNVIQAAFANKVRKVLFTSSDKAVNPTSVMGTSKLMGERLMTAANILQDSENHPIFASTRFGNVAGSRGSVIPLFCQQIVQGKQITLTTPDMTRFVMTLDAAVHLVIKSMVLSKGGEVFVTKMAVLNIKELADVMISLLAPLYDWLPKDIKIEEIGSRPGEKLYEELMNDEEVRRSMEAEELFIVLPAFHGTYYGTCYTYEGLPLTSVQKTYNSANFKSMTKDEIASFLMKPGVLSEDILNELQRKNRNK